MNTSRSDEQPSVTQTLGERIVMVARMMGAEHIRQVLVDDAGLDLVEIQRQIRERTVRQDLFSPSPTDLGPQAKHGVQADLGKHFSTAAPITLPERVKAKRKPPQQLANDPQREAA